MRERWGAVRRAHPQPAAAVVEFVLAGVVEKRNPAIEVVEEIGLELALVHRGDGGDCSSDRQRDEHEMDLVKVA